MCVFCEMFDLLVDGVCFDVLQEVLCGVIVVVVNGEQWVVVVYVGQVVIYVLQIYVYYFGVCYFECQGCLIEDYCVVDVGECWLVVWVCGYVVWWVVCGFGWCGLVCYVLDWYFYVEYVFVWWMEWEVVQIVCQCEIDVIGCVGL